MCAKVTLGWKELICCSVCPPHSLKHHPSSPSGAGMGFSLCLLLALLGATMNHKSHGACFPYQCPQRSLGLCQDKQGCGLAGTETPRRSMHQGNPWLS